MFRKMRRFKQELSFEECTAVLKSEKRGVLSLSGEKGYPYGIPMNHWYNENDGRLYFHTAKEGHKIDAIRSCDKASFCVFDKGCKVPDKRGLNVRSVVVFGRIRIVRDQDRAALICRNLSRKFAFDEEYIEYELAHSLSSVLCLELVPEHISGKLVNES